MDMFEIFDPMDKSRTIIHRTRFAWIARLRCRWLNRNQIRVDWAHESEPWI